MKNRLSFVEFLLIQRGEKRRGEERREEERRGEGRGGEERRRGEERGEEGRRGGEEERRGNEIQFHLEGCVFFFIERLARGSQLTKERGGKKG